MIGPKPPTLARFRRLSANNPNADRQTRETNTMPHVKLPYPPSANHLRIPANGRLITAPEYRAWQDEAVFMIRQSVKPIDKYPVKLILTLSTKNMRRDMDNAVKPIVDALVKSGALRDDNLAHVNGITIRLLRTILPERDEAVYVDILEG